MLNWKLAFCACFVLAICLTARIACAEPFSSSRGYHISSLPGWHIDSSGATGNDVIIYTEKSKDIPEGMPEPNLNVRIGPQGGLTTLEIAKRGIIKFYQKAYPNLRLLSQAYSSLGNVRDLDTVFLVGSPHKSIRIHQVLVLKNHSVYFFTSACPEQVHGKYDPFFSQMLKSVRWNVQ